ncbi:MAG: hypothetical protein JXA87_07490 [Thermoleophilia bacterium]|nr:hypothetical protein [Thermoleophilia bacterium]
MDEERLNPQLGRLIDRAKAAAQQADSAAPRAEGVALLGGNGDVYVGYPGAESTHAEAPAAAPALASARRNGCDEILAAAVAVAGDPAETVLPSPESHRVLAGIDPDLPLVVKYQGRWVMLPLSRFTLPE